MGFRVSFRHHSSRSSRRWRLLCWIGYFRFQNTEYSALDSKIFRHTHFTRFDTFFVCQIPVFHSFIHSTHRFLRLTFWSQIHSFIPGQIGCLVSLPPSSRSNAPVHSSHWFGRSIFWSQMRQMRHLESNAPLHSCVDSLFHPFIHPIGSDVQYSGVKCATFERRGHLFLRPWVLVTCFIASAHSHFIAFQLPSFTRFAHGSISSSLAHSYHRF